MTITVLDPSYGESPQGVAMAPRLATLEGAVVGVVSNGKKGTVDFFDGLAHELRTRYRVADVVRVTKPNYSAPAGTEIMDGATAWNALVSGIGD